MNNQQPVQLTQDRPQDLCVGRYLCPAQQVELKEASGYTGGANHIPLHHLDRH